MKITSKNIIDTSYVKSYTINAQINTFYYAFEGDNIFAIRGLTSGIVITKPVDNATDIEYSIDNINRIVTFKNTNDSNIRMIIISGNIL